MGQKKAGVQLKSCLNMQRFLVQFLHKNKEKTETKLFITHSNNLQAYQMGF